MTDHPFDPPRTPMEAKTRESIPGRDAPGEWGYEPKWDGFRTLAWPGDPPRLDSRNQKPLLRYFPELEDPLRELPPGTVIDGEVVIARDGKLDFDALSERIHPAESRIQMLSEQTPAQLVAFDLLALDGEDLRERPFGERREALEELFGRGLPPVWHLTPHTTDPEVGERWFHEFESAGCDGLVCKELVGVYVEGKREMIKVKHRRDVDCVVGGYRVHKDGPEAGIGSLLLGLYDDRGEMHFVGHCSNFSDDERITLYERLQELVIAADDDPFGDDARRPGEPSRWTGDKDLSWVPLEAQLVAQVSYGQLTNGRFRHATRFERWRPDKDPSACTMEQLDRPSGPSFEEVVRTGDDG